MGTHAHLSPLHALLAFKKELYSNAMEHGPWSMEHGRGFTWPIKTAVFPSFSPRGGRVGKGTYAVGRSQERGRCMKKCSASQRGVQENLRRSTSRRATSRFARGGRRRGECKCVRVKNHSQATLPLATLGATSATWVGVNVRLLSLCLAPLGATSATWVGVNVRCAETKVKTNTHVACDPDCSRHLGFVHAYEYLCLPLHPAVHTCSA